jgi:hypothetical protein
MAYIKTTWENEPSESTPINASNLNKMEQGIYQNSLKADQIGDLSNLKTTEKSDLVGAINELKGNEEYSTTEAKTNKIYIDGKPIYRKVVTGTLPTTNYSTFITIDNLDTPISENILITMSDNSRLRLPFVNLTNNIYCDYYISGNNYNVHFSTDTYKSRPFIAILEYTKTTD